MGRCPLPPPLFCGSAARFVVGGANHLLSVAKASLHVAPSLFGHQKFEREADLGRDLRQLNNFPAASGATQSTRNNKPDTRNRKPDTRKSPGRTYPGDTVVVVHGMKEETPDESDLMKVVVVP